MEWFVQFIMQECLDHFIIFGTQQLDCLRREYVAHYQREWPHQGQEDELLVRESSPRKREGVKQKDDLPTLAGIRCHLRVGGLWKPYSQIAT